MKEVREPAIIESEWKEAKERKYQLRHEWLESTSPKYREYHSIKGTKKIPGYIMILILVIGGLATLAISPMIAEQILGPELHNGEIYACPNGDWSGTTAEMISQPDRGGGLGGGLNLYCPIDGQFIGHKSSHETVV
jgi:hypothetical protein